MTNNGEYLYDGAMPIAFPCSHNTTRRGNPFPQQLNCIRAVVESILKSALTEWKYTAVLELKLSVCLILFNKDLVG
jgi:hypothetical protein